MKNKRKDYKDAIGWERVSAERLERSINLNVPQNAINSLNLRRGSNEIVNWKWVVWLSHYINGISDKEFAEKFKRDRTTLINAKKKLQSEIDGFANYKLIERLRLINYYAVNRIEAKKCNDNEFNILTV